MTDLARRETVGLVDFNDGQIDLIKRQLLVPKDRQATNDELALFIGQAKRTGLDPFSRQIYGVFRWDTRSRGEKMTIQASIDGLRLVAERSGHYLGQSGPFWCGEDGEWREIWPKGKGHPVAAKVVVRKLISGQIAETPAVAHWDEYVQTKKDGSPTQMWGEKSALMLAKCAEALALRKAFPNDMSGLYTAEEMSRADMTAQPAPASTYGQVPPVSTREGRVARGLEDHDGRVLALTAAEADREPSGRIQTVKLKDGREGSLVGLPNAKGEMAVTPYGDPTVFNVKPEDIETIDGVAVDQRSDIPADWPPKEPPIASLTAEAAQGSGLLPPADLMVDESFAVDIAAEFKRQGLNVGDFRAIVAQAGVTLPEDLRSRESRLEVLQALTLDQALSVANGLKARARATKQEAA